MGKVRIRSLTGRPEKVGHFLVSHKIGQWLELDEEHLPKALPQLIKDGKVKVVPVLEAVVNSVVEEPKVAELPPTPPEKEEVEEEVSVSEEPETEQEEEAPADEEAPSAEEEQLGE